jgi:protocatechuate 3,4-dioxygenase beta subunit
MKAFSLLVVLLALGNDPWGRFTFSEKRSPGSFQGATITGKVVDAQTMQLLRGAVVSAARVPSDKPGPPSNIGFRTGEDGKFILRGVATGTVYFVVSKPGYMPGPYKSVRPGANGESIENIVLTVAPAASISGRVADESGQPVAGATVVIGIPVGESQRTFRSRVVATVAGDDGEYWIGGLSAGEYAVAASPSRQIRATEALTDLDPSFGQTFSVKLDAGEQKTGLDVVVPLRPSSSPADPGRKAQGTGTVSGRVIDTKGRSVSNTVVLMISADPKSGASREMAMADFTARTDGAGNFLISGVPPGTFAFAAMPSGLPSVVRFSAPPSAKLTTVVVKDGAATNGIVLTMRRGAVISGTVTDEFGDPVMAEVTIAGPYQSEFGAFGQTVTADARGRYRIAELLPGEYLLSVRPPSVAEVHFDDYAGQDHVMSAAPVFYPGVPRAALASRVAVAAEDERTGIDFTLRPVALTSINVTVTSTFPVKEFQLHHFTFDDVLSIQKTMWVTGSNATVDVAPGRYRLLAAAYTLTGDEKAVRLWSMLDVDADAMVPTTVTMTLEPGARISGRVVFEGTSDTSRQGSFPSLLSVDRGPETRLGISPDSSAFDTTTGRFSLEGLLPGRYVIQAGPTERSGNSTWVLKAATIDGRDVLEQPIVLGPGTEIGDALLTVTDRGGELSGTVTDAAGKPALSDRVVLFSADRRHWYPGSRRTRVTRPNQKGAYVIRGLPAGSYVVALSQDYLPQDDALQSALQALSTSGVRVTIGDGERKVQDLRSRQR